MFLHHQCLPFGLRQRMMQGAFDEGRSATKNYQLLLVGVRLGDELVVVQVPQVPEWGIVMYSEDVNRIRTITFNSRNKIVII